MKRLMLFVPAAFLFAALASAGAAMTAREIIEKAEAAVRGDSQIARFDITIKTRRWTRTLKMKSWDNRKARKSFAEILAPKKDAGNRFLMIHAEGLMWHYNPDIGKEMKIHPSMMLQSWMGSDFTNDDIVKESSIINDYEHSLDGRAVVDGHECYVIRMDPKPDAAVVWGRVLYYARTQDCLPVKEEFYDQHGRLKRVLTFSGFRVMGGRMIPTIYKMVTLKKNRDDRADEYTMMEIKDIVFNVPIPSSVFSLQHLKRR